MTEGYALSYRRSAALDGLRDNLGFVLRISRFRFWIYTLGTYVVGFALGAGELSDFFLPEYYIYLLYFLLPANLFIYGVNDYWDEDTDRLNPKKDEKEYRIRQADRYRLKMALLAVVLLSAGLLLFQDNTERVVFGSFVLLAYFYSAGPLRLKSRPVLDSSSNVLYLMPGIFGFYLAAGDLPLWPIVLAGVMHTTAMHLFSAIPDIGPDRAAGLRTTATELGRERALLACLAMWSVLAAIAIVLTGFHPLSFLALVYPAVPLSLLVRRSLSADRLYWYLPYINTSLGGLLFAALVIRLL